jgi:16S rRNA (guanine1207-N2)-methyltransferase
MIGDAFRHALAQVTPDPGRQLWLLGEPGLASGDVYQPWHGAAHRLRQEGCTVLSELEAAGRNYAAIFVLASKQIEETEGLIALALDRSQGLVMAGAANDAGGGRLAKMMAAYGVEVHSHAKSKCRIVWTRHAAQADPILKAKKLASLEMRPLEMEGETWWTQPGLFGWDKIDPGSALLLRHLPADLAGKVADFGCGYGYLSAMLGRRHDAIESIEAFDADARAVACCRRNTSANVRAFWEDVADLKPQPRYDAVVMNPPFHQGKPADVSRGALFIRRAHENLKPGGRLFLVANRHLAYEKTVPGLSVLYQDGGYKIITGMKT